MKSKHQLLHQVLYQLKLKLISSVKEVVASIIGHDQTLHWLDMILKGNRISFLITENGTLELESHITIHNKVCSSLD